MAYLIDAGAAEPIALGAVADALQGTRVDPRDEKDFVALAPLVAGLARDPGALGELAVAERDRRSRGERASAGFGAYAILLYPRAGEAWSGRFVLRARFWPTRFDPLGLPAGAAPAYYDRIRTEPWPVLAAGIDGPGCESEVYARGADGRVVRQGGYRLAPTRVRLRCPASIECRRPPARRSVSIELVGTARTGGSRCYDADTGRAGPLDATPAASLRALALAFGGGDADEFLRHLTERCADHADGRDRDPDRIRNGP